MQKLLAIAAVLETLTTPAGALTFTLSDFAGSGNFGSITAHFTNAAQTQVEVDVNMTPNVLLDTGSHWPLTLSLAGTGRIVQSSLGSLFTAQAHHDVADYSNSPFRNWTDAIAGNCGSGGSSGCGSTMSFLIDDFQGFLPATQTFNGSAVFAAVDILLTNCTGGCAGAVGATGTLAPTPFSAVPGPLAGAGLPGLFAACFGLFVLARRRRQARLDLA
jgi:hypothetical protein